MRYIKGTFWDEKKYETESGVSISPQKWVTQQLNKNTPFFQCSSHSTQFSSMLWPGQEDYCPGWFPFTDWFIVSGPCLLLIFLAISKTLSTHIGHFHQQGTGSWTLVPCSKPAHISTSFEWNHCNQGCTLHNAGLHCKMPDCIDYLWANHVVTIFWFQLQTNF